MAGSPLTTPQRQMLAAGQVGQGSSVPWSLVGPGWLLADWAPTAAAPSADTTVGNPPGTVLLLVDPLGGRYALASGTAVPNSDLVAWSGDGTRALFETHPGGGANLELTVLDLTNGRTASFQVPISGFSAGFTEPNGLAILTRGGTASPAQRFDLTGALQLAFPTAYDQPGAVSGGIDSPDGDQLAFDASTGAGVALVTNDGRLVRNLPIPVSGLCSAVRWWSTNQILARCGPDAGPSLWIVPADGSAPNQLAVGNDAWQLLSGVYSSTGRCHMDTCTFGLQKLQPDGTSTPVAVPAQWSSDLDIGSLGAFQDRLAVFGRPSSLSGVGHQAGGFLDWLDPETGAATPLLGGPINGGSVNAAIMHEAPPPAATPTSSSPHFSTPESAMTYLASAWNRNDLTQLGFVTNPPARAALLAMHDEAVNLRLNHCTPRPQGDYTCYFDHDYPAGTSTTLPGGVGQAVFLVGPADTPGWYMTVFQGCG